ncbi:hypothetical protein HS088_TW04G00812 [Tripterygium wilfordii]|uniref:V-type proton ATPase subunit S1/VOA1 transmembrane domain-containing protein n=1 Tax=Tripterygium wilfordii TaxID=458696 RepID=A0A7J7DR33_TRIWF|nr:uncharacterized protein LOC119995883 [Tripterygium wilfordii]XP_038698279.1 uncharacterized protein LOC119995883 [Tripterygium wilfordii]KAF5748852.1 hypothetical protein HS088_TW04G00812 [Tripterygium wilfordii]
MMNALVTFFVTLIAVADIQSALALPSTVPAFLWSPHHDEFSSKGIKDAVNYQTIFPKDLAKSVLSEGGWANLLCSEKKIQHHMDVALVFVGRELLSSDISANKYADTALLDLLKVSYTRSNFSMAFPYVATSEEQTMENILFSGFMETCGWDSAISKVAFSESCSVDGENLQKLADPDSVHDFLVSNVEKRPSGQANLVVFCHGGSRSGQVHSPAKAESEIFSEVISSVEQSGAQYAVLYVSDPLRSIQYPTYRELERFLAEGVQGNGPLDSKICDEVCKIKSSLLEGLLVAIVLLIILISGLCCMMGIETPTRFEAPQES